MRFLATLSRPLVRASVLRYSAAASTATKHVRPASIHLVARSLSTTKLPVNTAAHDAVALRSQATAAAKPARKASTATAAAAKKKPAAPKKKKKAAAPKKKPAPKKKAAPKPKLKAWEKRDADGKLVPLPSATKPKRVSTFAFFVKDRIPDLQSSGKYTKKSPKTGADILDATEAIKALGAEWKTLSAAQREKYEKLSSDDKASYAKKLAAWEAALTPEDVRRQNAYARAQRKLGKVSGSIRDENKPTRPPTAFFKFLSEFRAGDGKGESVVETAKKAGVLWKGMGASEKQPYEQSVAPQLEQYKKDLEAYKRSITV